MFNQIRHYIEKKTDSRYNEFIAIVWVMRNQESKIDL